MIEFVDKIGRGRRGQSSYTAHFHQTARHILMRHCSKYGIGYQGIINAMSAPERASTIDRKVFDDFNWEDIRDVLKKGRWLGDEKLDALVTYLTEKEAELCRSLDMLGVIERLGEAFTDFYVPPPFSSGTYAGSEIRQRLKLHDVYRLATDHGSPKPMTFGPTFPKDVDRFLVLREAEGFPFLLSHEFSIPSNDRARHTGDWMSNLYGGFCLPAPDFVIIHSRGVKYRNFRTLAFREEEHHTFSVLELHMPKITKRVKSLSGRERSFVGPYRAYRLQDNSKTIQLIEEYIDMIWYTI